MVPQYTPHSDRILTFASGDSWSDAWFNLTGPQPGPGSPFGNSKPSYPDETAVYGAYWFMYLTTEFNQSFIETYCFARSADTVNASITPHGSDFVHEVRADFLPLYGGSDWHSTSSLFAMFFGVNDSHMVAEEWEDDIPMLLDNIFATYNNLVEQVSSMGFTYYNSAKQTPSFTKTALATSCSSTCRRWIEHHLVRHPKSQWYNNGICVCKN